MALPDYGPIEAFLVGRCGKSEREAGLTSFHEYQLLTQGRIEDYREKMTIARWIAFRVYEMNPYIKPPRSYTEKSYCRFGWEEITEEEAKAAAERCIVTEEEQDILNEIFERKKNEIEQ